MPKSTNSYMLYDKLEYNGILSLSFNSFQCLSLIPSVQRAETTGNNSLKLSISCTSNLATSN